MKRMADEQIKKNIISNKHSHLNDSSHNIEMNENKNIENTIKIVKTLI